MRIASNFVVPAEPESIFDAFLDPNVMQRCITGCEKLERQSDTCYRGQLSSEVAHVRFRVGFEVNIVEMERPRSVRAVLSGEDRKLGSSLKLTAALTVEPAAEGATVDYEMDLAIWGKLGRLGEPIIRRRSAEVEREFVRALRSNFDRQSLEPPLIATSPQPNVPVGVVPSGLAPQSGASTRSTLTPPTPHPGAAPYDRHRAARHLLHVLLRARKVLDILIGKLQ